MTERRDDKTILPILLQCLFGEIMRISSATSKDQVLISAHIRSIYRPKYQCEKQLNELRLKNKKADDNYIENIKKARGCGYVTKHLVERIGNIEYYTCLCQFKHPLTGALLSLSKHYDNGVMPFKGSLLEQPAQIVELLELVNSAKIEEEIELQKQQQIKVKKHGR